MQDDHQAVRVKAGDESRALSLRFRQDAYETAVKAQRELITASLRAAARCLSEIVLLAISVSQMAEHSNRHRRTKRAYAADAA